MTLRFCIYTLFPPDFTEIHNHFAIFLLNGFHTTSPERIGIFIIASLMGPTGLFAFHHALERRLTHIHHVQNFRDTHQFMSIVDL